MTRGCRIVIGKPSYDIDSDHHDKPISLFMPNGVEARFHVKLVHNSLNEIDPESLLQVVGEWVDILNDHLVKTQVNGKD